MLIFTHEILFLNKYTAKGKVIITKIIIGTKLNATSEIV